MEAGYLVFQGPCYHPSLHMFTFSNTYLAVRLSVSDLDNKDIFKPHPMGC